MNYAEMGHTPGYFYAIAYALAAAAIVSTGRLRRGKAVTAAAGAAAFAVLLVFMKVTDGAVKWAYIASMAAIVCWIGAYIYLFCSPNLRTVVFYTIKAFICGELCSSFCWQLVYYFCDRVGKLPLILLIVLFYAGSFFLLYMVEKNLHDMENEPELSVRDIFFLLLIAGSVYIISNSGYVFHGGLFSGSFSWDIYIVRTLVDLSGVVLIYAFQFQMQMLQTRFEADTLRSMLNMQYTSYKLSRDSIDLVNQKYHDLKHQIALLKAEAGSGSAVRLEQMENEIRIYETQNRTGSRVLDTVLTVKSLYCQKKGIDLKVIADGTQLEFMDDMDVSALFGNMLDNAIESVKNQDSPEKRTVRLYLAREKQFVRICQENYCGERILFRDGLPQTTKKDQRIHGYGMKSIRSIVEKYQGTMRAEQKNDWFVLRILLPLPQEVSGAGTV